MCHKRPILLTAIAFSLMWSMNISVFGQSGDPSKNSRKPATVDEAVSAGINSADEGDWASAESHFREAMRLEPKQPLWRIQVALTLGQQKKWKKAFSEIDTLARLGAIDWLLTINKKLPDGTVAFVNTETFGDEQRGIPRYVKAVKEKKKVESVSADIGVKLDDFAKEHNIALMYDISKFKHMRFAPGKPLDVTGDFIAYYNERYRD